MKFIFYLGIGAIVLFQEKRSTAAQSITAEDLSEVKSNFTSRITDSIKKVKWGCARGTKCYEQSDIWNKLKDTHDIKQANWNNKTKKGNKNKNKKKDEGSRNNAYRSRQSKRWTWKALSKH